MAAAPAKPPGPRDGGWLSRPVLLAVERVARGRAHRVPLVAAGATLVFVAAVMSTMMIGRGEDAPEGTVSDSAEASSWLVTTCS